MATTNSFTGSFQLNSTSGVVSVNNGQTWIPIGTGQVTFSTSQTAQSTGTAATFARADHAHPKPIVACEKFHEVSPGICGCSRPYDEHPERTIDIAMGILRKLRG